MQPELISSLFFHTTDTILVMVMTHEGRSRFYGDPDPRSNDEASDARSTESTSATVELQQDTQRRENEEKE